MKRQSIMIDFDDPRAERVAEVISNKSCKKMLSLLSTEELSESELASKLGLPVSTVNYNMKKLVDSGLVDKTRSLVSSKGKDVRVYRISNQHIVLSPRSLTRGVVPALLISGVFALLVKFFGNTGSRNLVAKGSGALDLAAMSTGAESSQGLVYSVLAQAPNSWAWFFLGALLATLVVMLWNWSKK
jgi:DNA-binding transcriptional ArsR family regulator